MKSIKVKSIRKVGQRRVIDLTVHKNHTFITRNGLVVHNCVSTQPALRAFMEEFSSNCRFILTCNFEEKILKPIHSRCVCIDFKIPKDEKPILAKEFFNRVCSILKEQEIQYNKNAVIQLIKKYFPDFRRVLNEIQRYSVSGVIDAGILVSLEEKSFTELIKYLKDKDFNKVRSWIVENSDQDISNIVRAIYENIGDHVEPHSVPEIILILADYQYKHSRVADPEINLAAMMIEIITSANWKG